MSYGTEVPMPEADAGSGTYRVSVSETISGLTADTVYHYRIVATNSEGTTHGVDRSFTTSTNPYAPTPGSEPEAGQNPGGGSSPARVRVKEARVGARTILTTAKGRTLYSLSAEKRGRFICTKSSGCLSIWHPLLVPAGTTPKGPVKLGTIERPEGGVQATFRGRPLYSFDGDQKPGQTRGNGLKDVGTWHPATVSTHKRR
jgi:predicted lipoprotein with Yx(FWY)xxD motif